MKKVKILAEIFGWDQINLTQYKHLFPRIYGGLLSIFGIFAFFLLMMINSLVRVYDPSDSAQRTDAFTIPFYKTRGKKETQFCLV